MFNPKLCQDVIVTKIKIVPDNAPDADGEWITAPTKVLGPIIPGSWFGQMMILHEEDIPDGYHAVMFETVGGTWVPEN